MDDRLRKTRKAQLITPDGRVYYGKISAGQHRPGNQRRTAKIVLLFEIAANNVNRQPLPAT